MEDRRAVLNHRPHIAAVEAEEACSLEACVPEVVEHPFLPAVTFLNGLNMGSGAGNLAQRKSHKLFKLSTEAMTWPSGPVKNAAVWQPLLGEITKSCVFPALIRIPLSLALANSFLKSLPRGISTKFSCVRPNVTCLMAPAMGTEAKSVVSAAGAVSGIQHGPYG